MAERRHDGGRAAARRIRLIAGQTLGEALRLRLSALLGAVAALLVVGSRWLQEFNFGAPEIAFLGDFGLGVIGAGGTLLAVLLTAHLCYNDLAAGVIACVLTRPARRWEWVAGKWLGASGALAVFTVVLGGLLGGLMTWRCQQLGVPCAALSLFAAACALQWMKATLVVAMTLVVSVYAGSPLFASGAGLLLALIGHLRPFATGTLEWLRIWPNLAVFDGAGLLAGNLPLTGPALWHAVAYWALSCAWLGAFASYVFKHREF